MSEQHVGGQIVADRSDQGGQIGGRQRIAGQVLPESGVGDLVLRSAFERCVRPQPPVGEAHGNLDQQEELADGSGPLHPVGVLRDQHGPTHGVTDLDTDQRSTETQFAKR